jgi:hypothetical protein
MGDLPLAVGPDHQYTAKTLIAVEFPETPWQCLCLWYLVPTGEPQVSGQFSPGDKYCHRPWLTMLVKWFSYRR